MKYSIITPVFNREDCIVRCIESVIRNFRNDIILEHIIIDDGSKDNSPNLIREYSNLYNHIKFISFPQNRGTNAARNAGISIASGDFCIILDSDDYFVDDAISFIDSIVKLNHYKAYMFSADDMLCYYNENKILKGRYSIELNFRNFLRGDLGGDFIHCICTDILKNNPFDDNIRTFEAVFFIRFFKEAQNMLFINRVVTIRERNRKDSVTRTMIAANKEAINKYYYANLLRYNWFKDDYIELKEFSSFGNLLNKLLYYSLLLSDRINANKWYNIIKENHIKVNKINKIMYDLRIGHIYYLCLKFYFFIKYDIINKKIS